MAHGLAPDRTVEQIERMAADAQVSVERVARKMLDERSERGAHQGVMAEAAPFRYAQLSDIIAASPADNALVIVLDHVTDPGNFGAIVRSAEVVGATGVVVAARRSVAITPSAWKAAAGALAHVPVAQVPNIARALEDLKAAGFWIAGASERAEQTVWDAPLEGRLGLVMGSEGSGLARLTQERCDFLVRLPQAGRVGSLNVAQATTTIAYEWLRRSQARGR